MFYEAMMGLRPEEWSTLCVRTCRQSRQPQALEKWKRYPILFCKNFSFSIDRLENDFSKKLLTASLSGQISPKMCSEPHHTVKPSIVESAVLSSSFHLLDLRLWL